MLRKREGRVLCYLMKYGEGGRGRLGNRGFLKLEEFGISRTEINRIVKPLCTRPYLRFGLSREHAHLIWRDNRLAGFIRYRMPPKLPDANVNANLSMQYVNEFVEITPQKKV